LIRRVYPFEYADPETLDEALDLLAQHGAEAKALAGGQSLVPILNYRLAKPRIVVDLNRLDLASIRLLGDRIALGALTRHCDIVESPDIAGACPVLGEAARLIGNVRVRALGTAGGSLAHADPAAELPLVMIALDASLTLRSVAGTRRVAARDFCTGYLTTVLESSELITEIEVPATRGKGTAIEEMARRVGDFAMVAVAAVVSVDRRGRVDEARLAYAGIAPRPLRAQQAEEALVGHEPTTERLALVARTARASVQPHSDAFVSAAYRSLLVEVLGRRALTRAVGRALEAA
jgi:aerobic carbon-monoxide dehydrogenase medium subunit